MNTITTNPNRMMGYPMPGTIVMHILIVIICIFLAWWALQSIRFDVLLREPRSARSRILQILLAVVIGYGLARFALDYLQWAALLRML